MDAVSFDISSGEIVGLLGHNGAGKSTILKMLTGFLEPSDGQIEIDGIDITDQPESVRQKIGYLPENCPLYPEMTVIDYLEYAAELCGVPDDARNQAVRDVIARHGISARRALGQHFLLDLNLTRRIAKSADLGSGGTVIEIGPGPGGLTRALLETDAAMVCAVSTAAMKLAGLAWPVPAMLNAVP